MLYKNGALDQEKLVTLGHQIATNLGWQLIIPQEGKWFVTLAHNIYRIRLEAPYFERGQAAPQLTAKGLLETQIDNESVNLNDFVSDLLKPKPISISTSKTSNVIAREIERRLLDGYIKCLDLAVSNYQRERARQAQQIKLTEELGNLLGSNFYHSYNLPYVEKHINLGGKVPSEINARVAVDCQSVEIRLLSLPLEVAKSLIEYVLIQASQKAQEP